MTTTVLVPASRPDWYDFDGQFRPTFPMHACYPSGSALAGVMEEGRNRGQFGRRRVPSQCRYRVNNRSKSSLSDVEARGHASDHVAVELITGDTAQLAKDGLAVTEDIDIGIGGIKSNGLARIEDEAPGTFSMLDGGSNAPVRSSAAIRASASRANGLLRGVREHREGQAGSQFHSGPK